KANNQIQIRLQNEMNRIYRGQFVFEIKRGELMGEGVVISNEIAGVYLMAFDLGEPWATHRKHEVFEDKHADLFGRPEVTADRIVFCQVIIEVINSRLPKIENQLLARYALTKYMLLYVVREILEKDDLASKILSDPKAFVRNVKDREWFRVCIGEIVDD